MIYPDVSLEKWLAKYPMLDVMVRECDACGGPITNKRPYITRDYVGLDATPCPCGKGKVSCSSFFTTSARARREWDEALGYAACSQLPEEEEA